jgi:AcrR family transcriptional regulator
VRSNNQAAPCIDCCPGSIVGVVATGDAAKSAPEAALRRTAVLGQTRSRQTRREIVNTAIRLWQTEDFDDITVDAIVEAAGVSKGTFYYHFRRKEDLLVDLGWATVDRVGTAAEEDYRRNGDLDRAIGVGIAGLVRRVTAMPPGAAARTIQEFGFRRAGPPYPVVSGPRSATSGRHGFVSGLLQAAQDAGDIAPPVDTDEVADVINHVFIQSILESVTGTGANEPLQQVLARRAHLVLHGTTATYLGPEAPPTTLAPRRRRASRSASKTTGQP